MRNAGRFATVGTLGANAIHRAGGLNTKNDVDSTALGKNHRISGKKIDAHDNADSPNISRIVAAGVGEVGASGKVGNKVGATKNKSAASNGNGIRTIETGLGQGATDGRRLLVIAKCRAAALLGEVKATISAGRARIEKVAVTRRRAISEACTQRVVGAARNAFSGCAAVVTDVTAVGTIDFGGHETTVGIGGATHGTVAATEIIAIRGAVTGGIVLASDVGGTHGFGTRGIANLIVGSAVFGALDKAAVGVGRARVEHVAVARQSLGRAGGNTDTNVIGIVTTSITATAGCGAQ